MGLQKPCEGLETAELLLASIPSEWGPAGQCRRHVGKVTLTGGQTGPGRECECLRLEQSTWTLFPSQLALAVWGPRFSPVVVDGARATAPSSSQRRGQSRLEFLRSSLTSQ